MEVLASGNGPFPVPDPDGHGEYLRRNKPPGLVGKRTIEQEATGNRRLGRG